MLLWFTQASVELKPRRDFYWVEPLVLKLLQINSRELFIVGQDKEATSFPSTFVLHIPASLLMWIDTGQGEHLGKLPLCVPCLKHLVVVSRVRACWPLSRESSINELVILKGACYPKPHWVNGAVKKKGGKNPSNQSWAGYHGLMFRLEEHCEILRSGQQTGQGKEFVGQSMR